MIAPITLNVCARCRSRSQRSFDLVDGGEEIAGACEACNLSRPDLYPVQYNIGVFNIEDVLRKLKAIKNRRMKAKNLTAVMVASQHKGIKLTSHFNTIVELSRACSFNYPEKQDESSIEEYTRLKAEAAVLSELCKYHGVALITAWSKPSKRDLQAELRPKQLRRYFAKDKA